MTHLVKPTSPQECGQGVHILKVSGLSGVVRTFQPHCLLHQEFFDDGCPVTWLKRHKTVFLQATYSRIVKRQMSDGRSNGSSNGQAVLRNALDDVVCFIHLPGTAGLHCLRASCLA